LSLIVALGILGLINVNDNFSVANDQKNVRTILQDANPSNESLKILNHQMTKPVLGNWRVEGQVKNHGPLEIRYFLINIDFFDEKGINLNSSSIKLYNIQPGEVKDFEIEYSGNKEPKSYKLELSTHM
jgi:hypothetical protein